MWVVWSVMLRSGEGSFENRLDNHPSDRIASIKSVQKNVIRKSLLPERIAIVVFPNALN
jgi:hypothetical protein